MPNLFLSHAWEDKETFVRPLAEALKSEFQVWYDEYSLRPGDSLLQKISEGLRNCDRGIAVLSPHFFAKEWPQAELNGLFALETNERKIIIPIWLDVTKQEVLNFSPILADKVGILASQGIPGVVAQIRGVVQGETETREVLTIPLSRRFIEVGRLAALRKRQRELELSPEGVAILTNHVNRLFDYFEQKANELRAQLNEVYQDRSNNQITLSVTLPGTQRMIMQLELYMSPQDLAPSRLNLTIGSATTTGGRQYKPEFNIGDEVEWKYLSAHGVCVSRDNDFGTNLTGERVVDDAFMTFVESLEERLRRHD